MSRDILLFVTGVDLCDECRIIVQFGHQLTSTVRCAAMEMQKNAMKPHGH